MFTLHIDAGDEMRGGQWQALYLLRGLAGQGHRARLLAPEGSPLLEAALAQQLEAKPLRMSALAGESSGADLVHVHDARSHTLAMLLRKPLIVSRRVAFPVRRSLASRWKYRQATHFIAVSEYVKQTLIQANVDEARISVVYDGVPIPPPAFEEHAQNGARREAVPDLYGGARRALCASNAQEQSRVLALDSDDPGKGKQIIEQAAALAGVPVAFSKALSRDLPEAALFVYITDLEGLGSAALLAMAHGVPVIASNVGGLPEVIENGVTGLLTSNEPQAIARHIQRLLADRSLAMRLGSRARARIEKEFSIDRMVNDTLRVYERIVS